MPTAARRGAKGHNSVTDHASEHSPARVSRDRWQTAATASGEVRRGSPGGSAVLGRRADRGGLVAGALLTVAVLVLTGCTDGSRAGTAAAGTQTGGAAGALTGRAERAYGSAARAASLSGLRTT